jgi:hypothetical protein
VQRQPALQLCPLAAFKVFPIAHMYDMAPLLSSCLDAMQRSLPVPAPEAVQTQPEGRYAGGQQQPGGSRPGLFEWLALGDSTQSTSVVGGCLAELARQGAVATLRAAMQSPQSRWCVEELRAGTLMEVLNVAADLPPDWKASRPAWKGDSALLSQAGQGQTRPATTVPFILAHPAGGFRAAGPGTSYAVNASYTSKAHAACPPLQGVCVPDLGKPASIVHKVRSVSSLRVSCSRSRCGSLGSYRWGSCCRCGHTVSTSSRSVGSLRVSCCIW